MSKPRTALAISLSIVLPLFAAGCAAQATPDEESDSELIQKAESALGKPGDLAPLQAYATYDAVLKKTMVDLTSNQFQNVPTDPDPHDSDRFLVVIVYVDRPSGKRDTLAVRTQADFYGPNQIGPGGGCIHFSIPANVGDRLFIGGLVKLDGSKVPSAAASPVIQVVEGTWHDPDDHSTGGGGTTTTTSHSH